MIDLPEIATGRIVFNSRSGTVTEVQPTFYLAGGGPIPGSPVYLQPGEIRYVDIVALIPSEHRWRSQWGGMSLSYTGGVFDIWAQITLVGSDHSGSTDVTFSVLNGRGSDMQEAVWWMPHKGRAVIALGNSSGTSIRTTVQYSDGDSQVVNIGPSATEYVRLRALGKEDTRAQDGRGVSLRLNTVGPAGSLKVAGVVTSDDRLVSSIRFYDTQSMVQPNLFATNMKLSGHKPRIVLKNTSPISVTAQARFRTEAGEAANPVQLPAIVLRPQEIAELDLSPLMSAALTRSDLNTVSVQILNSGAPGTLIGAINGIDTRTSATYDVPLRDSGAFRMNTGSYPWRIDGDYTTIVSVTNVGDMPSRYIAEVAYPGGQYIFGDHGLAVGETAFFDLRKVRDERMPDANGDLLPATVTGGQFRWHSFPAPGTPHMIGRAAVSSLSSRISASYSCVQNCGANGPWYLIDGFTSVLVGGYQTMSTRIGWQGVYTWSEYNTNLLGAQMDDTSVADLGAGGSGWLNVNGLGVGNTFWSWTYSFEHDFDNGYDCENRYEDRTDSVPTGVDTLRVLIPNPPVTEVDGSSGVIAGQSFTITLQAINESGNINLTNSSTVTTSSSRTLHSSEIGLPSNVTLSGGQYTATVRLNRVNGTDRGTTFRFAPSGGGQIDLNIYTYFAVTASLEGLVGHATACGHTITSTDHFVALPSTGLCNMGVVVRGSSGVAADATTVRDVGPFFPNTPGPNNSNTCNGGNDLYWNTGGVPKAANDSCSPSGAAIDLANGTASVVGVSGLGPVFWRFD
jgi:hypothetical protein